MNLAKFYKTATTTQYIAIADLGTLNSNYVPGNYGATSGFSVVSYKGNLPTRPQSTLINVIPDITVYSSPHLSMGIRTYWNNTHVYRVVADTSGSYSVSTYVSGNTINVYLAVATINNVRYLGFLRVGAINYDGNYWDESIWSFCYNSPTMQNILSDLEIVDEAGNTALLQDLGGTDGSYNFTGDVINMPTPPDETVSGVLANGFLNIYSPSYAQLRSFGALLWTNAFNAKWYDLDSVANLVLNAISDPINYIVGLFMLPITPTTTGGDGIYLGGINANTVVAPRVSQQFKTIDFGTINIDELYGNYLDYSNSHVSIYLPYIGTADIDVQEVNGGSVTLQYIIDCFTGACVANVRCVKNTLTPWGATYQNSTVHSYSGNVALQLPISAGSFDTMLQGLINVGLGLGSNSPSTALTGVKDIMQGFAGDVTTRGSLSSNTGKLCYQTPYLMFTRPIESRPPKMGSLHGYSAGVGGKLSQFSGYVECTDVKLDGVTATQNELNEIMDMLKTGVYV